MALRCCGDDTHRRCFASCNQTSPLLQNSGFLEARRAAGLPVELGRRGSYASALTRVSGGAPPQQRRLAPGPAARSTNQRQRGLLLCEAFAIRTVTIRVSRSQQAIRYVCRAIAAIVRNPAERAHPHPPESAWFLAPRV